jgi:hypothetical protein
MNQCKEAIFKNPSNDNLMSMKITTSIRNTTKTACAGFIIIDILLINNKTRYRYNIITNICWIISTLIEKSPNIINE